MPKKLKLVRDQLIQSSTVAIVGEAPGGEEEIHGVPFVGPAGALLNRFLHLAGLRRPEVSILNVCLRRPLNNLIDKIPKAELDWWREDLRRRIATLPNLRIIVPVGNTALEAILGTARTRISQNKKLTIGKARGFYFDNVELIDGRRVLVLPIFHPAATFRDPRLTKTCEKIWERIGEEVRHGLGSDNNVLGPLLDDLYTIEPMPHPDEAQEYADRVIAEGRPLFFDIETPRTVPRDKIFCCSFTNDGRYGITIPYDDHRAVGPREWRLAYQDAIRRMLVSNLEKGGQNLLFDCFLFEFLKGIHVENVVYDTRTMDVTIDPRRAHDLSSITSLLHRCRYWKDADEESRVNDSYEDLARYCALDSLHTYNDAFEMRIGEVLKPRTRLEGQNLWKVYRNIYGRRFYPLLRMMLHGTLVDQPERARRFEELDSECSTIRDELEQIAGVSLAGEKSLSDQKISVFIHGAKNPPVRSIKLTPKKGLPAKKQPPPFPSGLELKPIIDKDSGRPTTNEVALRRHRLRVIGKNKRAEHALDLILDHRRKDALCSFFQEKRIDKDSRYRCSFGFAETARLTSSSNPYGTGGNSQNYDRKARNIFLPDENCIFLQVDLSQAEDRIIKAYSKDADLIRLARLKSWEYDAHSDLATKIFEVMLKQITKDQRYLAKRVRHAAQRGVGGQRFADELIKDDVVHTKQWCEEKLEAYHNAEPGIRNGYFPYVRDQIMRFERLVTPWGFQATFYGERKDEALMREALSFLAQAGCVLTLDLQGLIPLDYLIEHEMLQTTRINNEAHDAVIASAPLSEAYEVAEFLVENLEQPVDYDGVMLSIPADLKIGATLADDDSFEWKKFPTKDEFMREAERLFELAEKKRKDAGRWTKRRTPKEALAAVR